MRVTDMKGVDLSVFTFDYDLTLAALLMSGDGTILHRFGGRDHESADGRLSMAGLVALMKETVAEEKAWREKKTPRAETVRFSVEKIPAFADRLKKSKDVGCMHCHMVTEALRDQAQREGTWTPDDRWLWPLPDKVGLRLDPAVPGRVATVAKGSPAEKAGLVAGDVLEGDRTEADLQARLHGLPPEATTVALKVMRGGKASELALELPAGWKAATPLEYSWRPAMWLLKPDPGFGGRDLGTDEKKKLGLAADAFALRVDYLIDWGDRAETGKNAKAAGVQKGDVLLSADGESAFRNGQHFQAWFRLTRQPGRSAELKLLRDGKPVTVQLPVLP